MLPASDLTEILANLAALNLQPATAAAVLGALAPLLRTAETPPAILEPQLSRRRPRSSKRPRGVRRKRKYKRHAPTEARDRALAALKANPDGSTTDLAKVAKCSRSTVVKTRNEIEKAERKQARKARETTPSTPISKPAERRQRAQHFLREQLARGAKPASAVEDAAAKAHVDEQALSLARADLGIVVSRANTGGVQAVQWSLPG